MKNPTRKAKELPYRGLDATARERPGVPREAPPHRLPGAHWSEPEQQPIEGSELVPGQLDRRTPAFSTALPPFGLSGALRRAAHRIPDHHVAHWVLLRVADRIDVVQQLGVRIKRT